MAGDYEASNSYLEQALRFAKANDNKAIVVDIFTYMGAKAIEQSDLDQVRNIYEQILALAQANGTQPLIADSLHNLGAITHLQNNYEASLIYFRQCIPIYQTIGNQASLAAALNGLAVSLLYHGNYEEAYASLQQSLPILHAIGNQETVANNLNNLGLAAYMNNNYDEARSYLEQGLRLSQEIDYSIGMIYALNHLGFLHLKVGEGQAAPIFYQALKMVRSIMQRHMQLVSATSIVGFAWHYLQQGIHLRAMELFKLAQSVECQEKVWVVLRLNELFPLLKEAVGAEKLENYLTNEGTLELELVVQELLDEFYGTVAKIFTQEDPST